MYHINPKCLRILFLYIRTYFLCMDILYCAVLMLLFARTYFHFILSPLQKRHLNMTVQGHKTQKVLVMGKLIASISTTKTASELKPRLERVKLEWELVNSQLPLRIAELEYKRNVQVRACSGKVGTVWSICTPLVSTHRNSALHLINRSLS